MKILSSLWNSIENQNNQEIEGIGVRGARRRRRKDQDVHHGAL